MKMKFIITLILGALGAVTVVQYAGYPEAKLTAHIIGEDGQPIANAHISFAFTQQFHGDAAVVEGNTDSNGNFTAEGYTDGKPGSVVTKDGYYFGSVNNPHFLESKEGKWQPWDQTYTTVLRKKENPVALYARSMGSDIPVVGQPCGYDLEEADWVAPYGKGKTTDFIVTLTNRIYNGFQDFDVSAIITFPNDGDGIQIVQLPKEFSNSAFKWPRFAPESGYLPSLDVRNAMFPQAQNRKPINTHDENKTYFFRVRTVKQGDQIVSALYGKINSGINLEPRGAKICDFGFIYYLNPKSNDRNLEWDPTKNLFTSLPRIQQPREP
jgi:hypothetical protein